DWSSDVCSSDLFLPLVTELDLILQHLLFLQYQQFFQLIDLTLCAHKLLNEYESSLLPWFTLPFAYLKQTFLRENLLDVSHGIMVHINNLSLHRKSYFHSFSKKMTNHFSRRAAILIYDCTIIYYTKKLL